MPHILKRDIQAKAKDSPAWYLDHVMRLRDSSKDTDQTIFLSPEAYEVIVARKEGRAPKAIPPTANEILKSNGVHCSAQQPPTKKPTSNKDWTVRGPKMWAELHARARVFTGDVAAETKWLDTFARKIGCGGCQRHWNKMIAEHPPTLTSADAYFAWTVDRHNAVNRKLKKDEWTVEQLTAALHVRQNADGLGDAICGLYAACGLAEATGKFVIFHAHHYPWFEGVHHPRVRIVPNSNAGVVMDPNYDWQLKHASTRKQYYCNSLAEAMKIPPFPPKPPHKCPRLKTFDWCNDTARSDEPTVVILVPAIVHQPNHIEMVRVQSLLASRLSGRGFRVLSCIVFDSVELKYVDDVMAMNFTMGVFQKSPPTGIRRPTETGLRAIREVWGENVNILRIIQDTPVLKADSLAADILKAIGEPGDWIAGGIRTFHRQADNPNYQALQELAIPDKLTYEHVHGCLSFARLDVWERFYGRMPASVTHYADDDVMSQWILQSGGRLIAFNAKAWAHRHDSPADANRKLFKEHGGEDVPPREHHPLTLSSKGDAYTILFPFTAQEKHGRHWNKWTELANAIEATGMQVIALGSGDKEGKLRGMFGGTRARYFWGHSPEAVKRLAMNAAIVIGNDSGPSHLGGLLGVPTLAIHAGCLPHEFLFELAPSVRSVTPSRAVPRADHNPAALHEVTVEMVMEKVRKWTVEEARDTPDQRHQRARSQLIITKTH